MLFVVGVFPAVDGGSHVVRRSRQEYGDRCRSAEMCVWCFGFFHCFTLASEVEREAVTMCSSKPSDPVDRTVILPPD